MTATPLVSTRAGADIDALYRIPEVVRLLGQSRSRVYELIRSNRLRSVTEGRTRLIPASAIDEYVALLKEEATNRRAA